MTVHWANCDDNAIKSDRDKAEKRMAIHWANRYDNIIKADQQRDQKTKKNNARKS